MEHILKELKRLSDHALELLIARAEAVLDKRYGYTVMRREYDTAGV